MTYRIWTWNKFIVMLASHIWTRSDLSNNILKVNVQLSVRNVFYILPIRPNHHSHILVTNQYWTLVSYFHHSFFSANIYAVTKSSIQFLKWNCLQNRKICLLIGHKYHIFICILNNRSIIIYKNCNIWIAIHLLSSSFFQTILFLVSLYSSLPFFPSLSFFTFSL